jgi:hypothetical protein
LKLGVGDEPALEDRPVVGAVAGRSAEAHRRVCLISGIDWFAMSMAVMP